ncbi:MAG TPA: hypothetical protein VF695_08390 [Sphingomonas sp.]|jgi:hypothetical protein
MGQCVERLVAATPRELWIDMPAMADAAFAEAVRIADRHVEEPEYRNTVAQLRHARLEAGFRRDAKEHGLVVDAAHTMPRGGRYSVATADGVHLIRGNVQAHIGPPRASKFRRQFAEFNAWLTGTQLRLFEPVEMPRDDRLCAMLVVTANARGNPALPAWVGVGFPHRDLRTWLEIVPISDILAMYHDADTKSAATTNAPVEVKDRAVPKLKGRSEG